jgi:predicted RNase H-like HicB family nuclease
MFEIGIKYWDEEDQDYSGAYGVGKTKEEALIWAKQWATKYGDGSFAVSLFRELTNA